MGDSPDSICVKEIFPHEIRKYCASATRIQFVDYKKEQEGHFLKDLEHDELCYGMVVERNFVIACACKYDNCNIDQNPQNFNSNLKISSKQYQLDWTKVKMSQISGNNSNAESIYWLFFCIFVVVIMISGC